MSFTIKKLKNIDILVNEFNFKRKKKFGLGGCLNLQRIMKWESTVATNTISADIHWATSPVRDVALINIYLSISCQKSFGSTHFIKYNRTLINDKYMIDKLKTLPSS